jgi:hypothetical protein
MCDCIDKLNEQAIKKFTVDGVPPIIRDDLRKYFLINVFKWSPKNKRYAKILHGDYIRGYFKFCPICGEKYK